MFGHGLEDFAEASEDVAERAHGRQLGAEDVGSAKGSVDSLTPLVVAVVVITEPLAEEGGGTAGSAVGLGEIADAVRQVKPRMPLVMVRPAAKIVQAAGNSAAKWDTPTGEGGAQGVRVAGKRRVRKLRKCRYLYFSNQGVVARCQFCSKAMLKEEIQEMPRGRNLNRSGAKSPQSAGWIAARLKSGPDTKQVIGKSSTMARNRRHRVSVLVERTLVRIRELCIRARPSAVPCSHK